MHKIRISHQLPNMKKTQEEWVIKVLLDNGEISRNFALQNYVSRLGAIACDLKAKGWNLEGEYVKTPHGKDYVYKLVGTQPMEQKEYFVQGELVATKYVKV